MVMRQPALYARGPGRAAHEESDALSHESDVDTQSGPNKDLRTYELSISALRVVQQLIYDDEKDTAIEGLNKVLELLALRKRVHTLSEMEWRMVLARQRGE